MIRKTFYIPKTTATFVKAMAFHEGTTQGDIIERAVNDYMKANHDALANFLKEGSK